MIKMDNNGLAWMTRQNQAILCMNYHARTNFYNSCTQWEGGLGDKDKPIKVGSTPSWTTMITSGQQQYNFALFTARAICPDCTFIVYFQIIFLVFKSLFCDNDTLDCEQHNGRAAIRGDPSTLGAMAITGERAALKIPINIYFCDHVSVCLIPFLRFLSVPIFDISCAMLIFWYKGSRKKTGIYSQVDRKGRGGSPLPAWP